MCKISNSLTKEVETTFPNQVPLMECAKVDQNPSLVMQQQEGNQLDLICRHRRGHCIVLI